MASIIAQRLILKVDEEEKRSSGPNGVSRSQRKQQDISSNTKEDQNRCQEQPSNSALSKAVQRFQRAVSHTKYHLYTLLLFLESDFATFALPNTAFGMFGAFSGLFTNTVPTVSITSTPTSLLSPPLASTPSPPSSLTTPTAITAIFLALLKLLTFNTLNLLIFDLANQRLPSSIHEDAHNKPWRPLPTHRLTPHAAKRLLLTAIPTALVTCAFVLRGGVAETALLVALTWMYNDLGGGDRGYIVRNGIIAVAFAGYNIGSLKLAAGVLGAPHISGYTAAATDTSNTGSPSVFPSPEQPSHVLQIHSDSLINHTGQTWTLLISLTIFATMHVQDLKDQAGDSARGRHTMPLVLGDGVARCSIAVCTAVAAVGIPGWFWGMEVLRMTGVGGVVGVVGCVGLGATVAGRVLLFRDAGRGDKKTWKLWCAWCVWLYLLPVLKGGVRVWL